MDKITVDRKGRLQKSSHVIMKIILVVVLGCVFSFSASVQGVQGRNQAQEKRDQIQLKATEVKTELKQGARDAKQNAQEIRQDVKTRAAQVTKEAKEEFQAKTREAKEQFEARKAELQAAVKEKRETAKVQVEAKRQELRAKIATVKDTKKQQALERIYTQVNALNARMADHFLQVLNRIEEALARIKGRADKAEANGLDVSLVKNAIAEAETALEDARLAVQTQAGKTYSFDITIEERLRSDVGQAREALHQDLKTVKDTVQAARDAVHDSVKVLAEIPRVNNVEVSEALE